MAKNIDGDGSAPRKVKGRKNLFAGSIRLSLPDGTKKRPTVYGRTRTEVKKKIKELKNQNELAHKGFQISDEICSEYFERWAVRDRDQIKPRTISQRRTAIHKQIEPVIGHIPISKVTHKHILKIYSNIKEQKLTGHTGKAVKAILANVFSTALIQREISENPMHFIPKRSHPKAPDPVPFAIEEDEFQKLLSISDQYQAFWEIMAGTGMRLGEAMGLQWDRVNLDKRTIFIDRQVHLVQDVDTRKHSLQFAPTKTGNNRTIKFTRGVAASFKRHKAQQQLLIKPEELQDNLVFPNIYGKKQSGSMYNKRLAKRCTELGLQKLTCKDFRSTYATWCSAERMDIKTLHVQMGHKSEITTLRYYAAPTDETVEREVDKMEGKFTKAG